MADVLIIDLNEPFTLDSYTKMVLFRDDVSREVLVFPAELTAAQRRIIHTIAHTMPLEHISHGNGNQRQVHIYRTNGPSPPIPQLSTSQGGDASRRVLNRAATIDFNDVRNSEGGIYHGHTTLRGQQSSGFLGIPDSPSFGNQQNLRSAKSVADMRSFTPSPVPSTASFPHDLQSNIARYQDYGRASGASATPTLASTAPGAAIGGGYRDDGLINGFGSMSLGGNAGPNGGSPRRVRGGFAWDQDRQQTPPGPSNAGAIGSNRGFSMNYDNSSQGSGLGNPMRQPRGPSERGPAGFSRGRQNGHQARGSDELRQENNVPIIVE